MTPLELLAGCLDNMPVKTQQYLYGQNVCVAHDPSGAFNGKLKNVAGVGILGIGEVDRLSCLGVESLTELPLKPETLKHKP